MHVQGARGQAGAFAVESRQLPLRQELARIHRRAAAAPGCPLVLVRAAPCCAREQVLVCAAPCCAREPMPALFKPQT